MQINRVYETADAPAGLSLKVPSFPAGPWPPDGLPLPVENEKIYKPEGQFRVLCAMDLLRELAADEAIFKRDHPEWRERMFFLLGQVLRAPDGNLYSWIQRYLEAEDVTATSSAFSFGPLTWDKAMRKVPAGKLIQGSAHGHSIYSMGDPSGKTPCSVTSTSGLFLSASDVDTAYHRGFGEPFSITMVIDSDQIASEDSARALGIHELGKVFGVWGFNQGLLLRRSLVVI